MTSFWEILKSSKSLKASDAFAELWGKSIADSWDIITITGSLPLSFLSKGEALTNYRLHGTSEGAGVQTENIFDYNDCFNNLENYSQYFSLYKMNAEPNTFYTLHTSLSEGMAVSRETPFIICPSTAVPTTAEYGVAKTSPLTITTASDGLIYVYVRIRTGINPSIPVDVPTLEGFEAGDWLTIIKGSTAPTFYIPYGYQIPLTVESGSQSQDYPLYIGSTKLGAEEYVDYESGKVWKMVDGTLTPTDPPAPFPAILTYQGENTLSSTETVGEVSVTGKIKEI